MNTTLPIITVKFVIWSPIGDAFREALTFANDNPLAFLRLLTLPNETGRLLKCSDHVVAGSFLILSEVLNGSQCE